ncbi:MAG: family transposase [Pseudomonadota bacterium]
MIDETTRAKVRRLFFAEHWKVGTIAGELGLHWDTVRRAIEVDRFVSTTARVRPSMLDPYLELVELTLKNHPKLVATALFQMLKGRGYQGSEKQVRRLVARLRPRPRGEAFLRLQVLFGEQAQVDWGHFGKVTIGRAQRQLSCFVMVLARSRATFAYFTLDQTLESFLRCHERALHYFGGVPRQLLYDNLKSVVLSRQGSVIEFNPKFMEFAGHYRFDPRPCAPARGNEKGRVERRIRHLRESFFAGRSYSSVDDLNRQLARWLEEVANERKVPDEDLTIREALQQERERLLSLPMHAFPSDKVVALVSGKTPYLRFDLNDYSIPHRLVRKPLTLVASETTVRILDGTEEVARHERSWSKDGVVEDPSHVEALWASKRAAGRMRGRDRLRTACVNAEPFLEGLLMRGGNLGPSVARLLRLLERYGAVDLDKALAVAAAKGAFHPDSVAHLIDTDLRSRDVAPPLAPIAHDDQRVRDTRVGTRPLSHYDSLLSATETTP